MYTYFLWILFLQHIMLWVKATLILLESVLDPRAVGIRFCLKKGGVTLAADPQMKPKK